MHARLGDGAIEETFTASIFQQRQSDVGTGWWVGRDETIVVGKITETKQSVNQFFHRQNPSAP